MAAERMDLSNDDRLVPMVFIGFWFGFIAAMKVTVPNYYDYI